MTTAKTKTPVDTSDAALSLRRKSGVKGKKWVHHPPEKKIEVVTKWLALGNLRLVSDLTEVNYETIKVWKQSPWWNDIVSEVKASRNAALDTKLSKIVDRALETIADRLENGNVKYDFKKGEAYREPVTIKDATSAAKALMDQQLQMEKLKVVENSAATVATSVQDQIKMLAQEFAKFNTKRTVEMPKEAEDAVQVERLLPGETNGSEYSGSEEEQSETDDSDVDGTGLEHSSDLSTS